MTAKTLAAIVVSVAFSSHLILAGDPEKGVKVATKTAAPQIRGAVAIIEARNGSQISGKAVFTERDGQVSLDLSLENAAPGPHAVHLHEKGDCSAADASSAGGHWNPTSEVHGKWGTSPFHHGDIGNIVIGEDGKGRLLLTTDLWSIGGAPTHDVIGKAVIVHAKEDDFKTQPTGNAGGRVGCGVIQGEK